MRPWRTRIRRVLNDGTGPGSRADVAQLVVQSGVVPTVDEFGVSPPLVWSAPGGPSAGGAIREAFHSGGNTSADSGALPGGRRRTGR